MTVAILPKRAIARNQLQQWGVLGLMAVFLLGIALFIFLVLIPDLGQRAAYNTMLAQAKGELAIAQAAQAAAPAKMQEQLVAVEDRLHQIAGAFLNEAESNVIVNRLYTYAETTGAEIVNLQAAPAFVAPTHSQRDYRFQIAGTIEELLDFLSRIEEVQLRGFVVNQVTIAAGKAAAASVDASIDQPTHLLNMNVAVIASAYSTRTVLGPNLDTMAFGRGGDLPMAEVQRQVEVAWAERDWTSAITLLEEVVTASPDNAAAREALYRAHVNLGYHYLTERDHASAKQAFERGLTVLPEGREAAAELRQLAADQTLSHRTEDELREQVAQAKAAGNWEEVILLLRLVAAVDPGYRRVDEELNEAYVRYGDQLAAAGDTLRAEEQYQLAQGTGASQPAITNQSVQTTSAQVESRP